jgi:hypothetical protein
MIRTVPFVAVIGIFGLGGWAPAADIADQQQKALQPLFQEVRQLVRQYYPRAVISLSYDKKKQGVNIHFQYNTQTVRVIQKDSPENPVTVRAPYVGGIWCDMTLTKGRYTGPVANMEKGVTELAPDFYNHLVAPYSKNLDQHMAVVLRYPGGTPPEFLKRLDALVKNFGDYIEEPAK